MDEQRYQRIGDLTAKLKREEEQVEATRAELREAIRDAFPENHGQPFQRGVLAKVAELSPYTRETVSNIRDGKSLSNRKKAG